MSERMRTTHAYNLHLIDRTHCDKTGFPTLPAVDTHPSDLIGWNYARGGHVPPGGAVHFFLDDYQFEAIWRDPERYVSTVENAGTLLTPDFSLYRDMPTPMQAWNIYRSRALGAFWTSLGCTVIPTLQWAGPDTYEAAFSGIDPGGTVAVTTLGTHTDPTAASLWEAGMDMAIDTIRPAKVLLYGVPHKAYDWCGTPVIYYSNQVTERMRAHGRKRGGSTP